MLISRFPYLRNVVTKALGGVIKALFNMTWREFRSYLYPALKESQMLRIFCVNSPNETYLIDVRDEAVGNHVFQRSSFEFDKFETVLHVLQREISFSVPFDLLIDAGANIGTTCIPALKRGLCLSCIAIEPDPSNLKLLRCNLILNEVTEKTTVLALALGPKPSESLSLELSPCNFGDHRIATSMKDGKHDELNRNRISVPSTTLDSLALNTFASRTLLWLDLQGFEGIALQGATHTIANRPPIVVEFWPYGMRRADSFSALKGAVSHYSSFVDLRQPARKLPTGNLDSLFDNLGDKDQSTDLLFLP